MPTAWANLIYSGTSNIISYNSILDTLQGYKLTPSNSMKMGIIKYYLLSNYSFETITANDWLVFATYQPVRDYSLVVRELHSLHVHIYICVVLSFLVFIILRIMTRCNLLIPRANQCKTVCGLENILTLQLTTKMYTQMFQTFVIMNKTCNAFILTNSNQLSFGSQTFWCLTSLIQASYWFTIFIYDCCVGFILLWA